MASGKVGQWICFSVESLSELGLAVGELALMHATLPDQYGVVQMDLGPAIFLIVVGEIPEATSKLLVFLSGTHTKRRT